MLVPAREVYGSLAPLLDSLDIAFCLFDAQDRAVCWNASFLTFFPEHAGHVYPGEPYRENLHRFYAARLSGAERDNIERYVSDGLQRHRNQSRPFAFQHRGRRLMVASSRVAGGGRVRIWRSLVQESPRAALPPADATPFPIDLLDHLADGASIVDGSDRIVAANAAFYTLYDVPHGETVVGLTLLQVVQRAWARASLPADDAVAAMQDNLRFFGAPFEVELPNGRWRRVIAQRNQHGIAYFSHADITPLMQAMAELSQIAVTDPLTGLLNRRSFEAALEAACRQAVRVAAPVSLMLLDVDRFKTVNDGHGHAGGDECLRRIGRIIAAVTRRATDHAARLGGDEFVILLPNTDDRGARLIAEAIRSACEAEAWGELPPPLPQVTVSIGLCSAPAGVEISPELLLREADTMLYRAKRGGRDRAESCVLAGGTTGGVTA